MTKGEQPQGLLPVSSLKWGIFSMERHSDMIDIIPGGMEIPLNAGKAPVSAFLSYSIISLSLTW